MVWSVIQIKLPLKNYELDTDFGYVICDLDAGDGTLGQGHDTALVYDQQVLCKIYLDTKW